MNENHIGMLVGGLIVVACIVIFGYANALSVIIPITTTQLSCVIMGIIGGAIAIFSALREFR